jgi:molybdopterin/thiamine biosynthesis adenylyltransferase
MMNLMYEELFERNYGVFTSEQQERVREARVVIVGCGGIGGVVASALARSGLERFMLYEFDTFQPSNMNRQITCFEHTLGVNKARCVRETILEINPEAEVQICEQALRPDEIDDAIQQGDAIIPAADEWPLSIAVLDRAKDLGKPSIMAYPVGALARVSTFLEDSPYASECLVMPYRQPYRKLKSFMEDPHNRHILQYYRSEGAWREDWFDGWCQGELPHAQLCSPVWITGALAAMEIVKLFSGKWKPVTAPRYWHITPTSAKIARFGIGRRLLSRMCARPWGQAMLPAIAKRPGLVRLFTRVIS